MPQWHQVGFFSLRNYKDDARSNKLKIHLSLYLQMINYPGAETVVVLTASDNSETCRSKSCMKNLVWELLAYYMNSPQHKNY